MNDATKFVLRDVRCFADKQEFNIRPLTFLVGENSTGKSTILGCIQALGNLYRYSGFPGDIDFNSEPYQMGSFSDIVRRATPVKKKFELGVEYEESNMEKLEHILTLTEDSKGSEPIFCKVQFIFGSEGHITLAPLNAKQYEQMKYPEVIVTMKAKNKFKILLPERLLGLGFDFFGKSGFLNCSVSARKEYDDNHKKLISFIKKKAPVQNLAEEFARIYSIAPIRSKPKRTYDPSKQTETPEGSEIPLVMMNLKMSSKQAWDDLKLNLLAFGKASGLFSDVAVRKLGNSKSDPFQVQFKVRGPKNNLIDVGYGVNQILPILVRIVTERESKFLLQQPEVHLHPKAQAAFASLLVKVNKSKSFNNSFIVETHSDYMIDRARIEITNGNINHKDVSLIYLQPVGSKIKVNNISFDKQANMIGVPAGYRDFFMKEGNKLLGFPES